MLDRLWQRLEVGTAIRRVAAGQRLDGEAAERVIFALAAQRAPEPASKLAATRWAAERVFIEGYPGSPTMPPTGRWTSCSARWRTSPRRSSTPSRT